MHANSRLGKATWVNDIALCVLRSVLFNVPSHFCLAILPLGWPKSVAHALSKSTGFCIPKAKNMQILSAVYLAMQRQRETGVQQVKAEVDTFKPQVRSFPIVVLQPDSHEVACGRKVHPPTPHPQIHPDSVLDSGGNA